MKEKLLLVLMGLVIFSSFSSTIMIDWLHFPISLPELLFIPFLIIFRNKFNFTNIGKNRIFYILVYIWLFLILFSIAVGEFSPFSIISTARGYLYIFIFYVLFSNENDFSIDDALYVSLGSLIGWVIASYFNFLKSLASLDETVSYGAMLAIPLFISISLIKKKYRLFIFGVLLIVFISFTSGLRRQILVFIISLFFTTLLITLRNPKLFFRISILALVFILPLILTFPVIESFFKENTPKLHYRIFTKSEALIKGQETRGDRRRSENFKYLIDNIDSFLYPRGLVSKQTTTNRKVGIYNDFPLLELSHVVSFQLAVFLIIIFALFAGRNLFFFLEKGKDESLIFVLCFVVMFSLLFLEGSFLTFPYATPITGYCLGRMRYHASNVNT